MSMRSSTWVGSRLTSQSINGPLLKVFQSDLSSRRDMIEVQPVGIILLLVRRGSKLFLFVINRGPSLWIDPCRLIPNHDFALIEDPGIFHRLL